MKQDTNQQNNSKKPDDQSNAQVYVDEKVVKFNGDICTKRYLRGKFLGKGGFAKCYEFQNLETKRTSAAKIISKQTLTKARAKQKLMSEIKIHRSLHHQNIVSFEHFFEDADSVYILLELCSNQSLNELLRRRKRLHELEVQCYINQICAACKYLHSHRVIHRDLKLGNLFLNEQMIVKIGDFGLATKLEFEGERKRTICGTPNYIAPEVLEGKQGHSYEVDVWSIGVIIYTLIIGKPPFETSDVKTTYRRIRMNAYSFPDNVQISEPAKNLITSILNSDPSKRPDVDAILAHDWINNGGTIPRSLPASTLACPPSQTYINQFKNQAQSQMNKLNQNPNGQGNMAQTAPMKKDQQQLSQTGRNNQQQLDQQKLVQTSHTNRQGQPGMQGNDMIKMPKQNEVWVKKWVDYSSKYGLGYYLSNEATGVFFNDSTKIVLDPNGHNFDYMERRQSDRQDVAKQHTLSEYPKEYQKKVTLLQHFRSYLEGNNANKADLKTPAPEDGIAKPRVVQDVVYVKKWMRTRHAIMFRLSNKVVQVNFQDHTEIMLSSETKEVTYVNKRGERSQYPLSCAMDSANIEMVKRLKYTKDILTHMLNANGGTTMSSSRQSGALPGGSNNDFQKTQTSRPVSSNLQIEGMDQRNLGSTASNPQMNINNGLNQIGSSQQAFNQGLSSNTERQQNRQGAYATTQNQSEKDLNFNNP